MGSLPDLASLRNSGCAELYIRLRCRNAGRYPGHFDGHGQSGQPDLHVRLCTRPDRRHHHWLCQRLSHPGDSGVSGPQASTVTTPRPAGWAPTRSPRPWHSAAQNYTFSFASGTLSVTPATLTVSADATSEPNGRRILRLPPATAALCWVRPWATAGSPGRRAWRRQPVPAAPQGPTRSPSGSGLWPPKITASNSSTVSCTSPQVRETRSPFAEFAGEQHRRLCLRLRDGCEPTSPQMTALPADSTALFRGSVREHSDRWNRGPGRLL